MQVGTLNLCFEIAESIASFSFEIWAPFDVISATPTLSTVKLLAKFSKARYAK